MKHEVTPVGADREQVDTRQAFEHAFSSSRSYVAKIYSSRARRVTTIDHDIRDHLSIGRDRRRMSPARVRDLPAVRKRDLVRNGITSISTFPQCDDSSHNDCGACADECDPSDRLVPRLLLG